MFVHFIILKSNACFDLWFERKTHLHTKFHTPEDVFCLGHLAYLLIILSTSVFSVLITGFLNHMGFTEKSLTAEHLRSSQLFLRHCDLLYGTGKTLDAAWGTLRWHEFWPLQYIFLLEGIRLECGNFCIESNCAFAILTPNPQQNDITFLHSAC